MGNRWQNLISKKEREGFMMLKMIQLFIFKCTFLKN